MVSEWGRTKILAQTQTTLPSGALQHAIMVVLVDFFSGKCLSLLPQLQTGFYLGTSFFGGGEMVRGKYTLGRGLGPFPPGKC